MKWGLWIHSSTEKGEGAEGTDAAGRRGVQREAEPGAELFCTGGS